MYRDLVFASPGLAAADSPKYFKDSSFGIKPDDVARTVLAARRRDDRARQGLRRPARLRLRPATARCSGSATSPPRTACSSSTCCATSAAATSRRSPAAPKATAIRAGAVAGRALHRGRPAAAGRPVRRPLRRRRAPHPAGRGELRRRHQRYIAQAKLNPLKMPGEYAAIGSPPGPDPWKATDIIATASLVGGIFGQGGGSELASGRSCSRAFRSASAAKRGRACGPTSRRRGPGGADDGHDGQALHLPGAAEAGRRRQRRDARPGALGSSRVTAARRAALGAHGDAGLGGGARGSLRALAAACPHTSPTRSSSPRARARAGTRSRSSARRSATSTRRS